MFVNTIIPIIAVKAKTEWTAADLSNITTLCDGSNFVYDSANSRIMNGSKSYNVNSGCSLGYVKIHTPVSSGTITVSYTIEVSSEQNWDFGVAVLDTSIYTTSQANYNTIRNTSSYANGGTKITGSIAKKTYTSSALKSDTDYYFNFYYAKDGSGNSNSDRFYIYGFSINVAESGGGGGTTTGGTKVLTNDLYRISYVYPDTYKTMTTIPDTLDISALTTMRYMFSALNALTALPQLNTSKITDMYQLCCMSSSIVTVPEMDTSKVTTMQQMFYGCEKLASIGWTIDMSSCTNCDNMFGGVMSGIVLSVKLKNVPKSLSLGSIGANYSVVNYI